MLRSVPTRARVTPRLELRPFRRRDIDPMVEAVEESWQDLAAWLPWAHAGYGRPEAARFVRDSAAAWSEGRAYDLAIRGSDLPGHLGNISIWPLSRRERSGEVGYWVRSSAAGHGIGTEAAARILQMGFEELRMHRITLRIAAGNRASERIAEKLGFVREGLLRREVHVHGVWMDHGLWALLEDEYRTEHTRWVDRGWLEP
ncbi:MAG: GNAT family protein [Acidimicrobiia bacterium]|nr:MAG: GNAT family protein [Acidimicrobiia bacterium]